MNSIHVAAPRCVAAIFLLLIAAPANADLVRVEAEKRGSGITRRRGLDCYLITAAHVIGGAAQAIIVGRGGLRGSAEFPRFPPGKDMAVMRIQGDRALEFCSERWPDSDASPVGSPWQVHSATPNGQLRRMDVTIDGESDIYLQFKPAQQNDSFFEGQSGSVVYAGDLPAAFVLEIPDTSSKEQKARAYRWSYLMDAIKVYFDTGTDWQALAALDKPVFSLALFEGRLYAATNGGGVYRYNDVTKRWDDVSGPMAGRALRTIRAAGVNLNATSDDYTTKKAGWSLMGDDDRWYDMGLTGFVVQSVREDHLDLHFATYSGYFFLSRGTSQPVWNNKGFTGNPYMNAIEPTDAGIFAGLGPGRTVQDGSGLWFLPKGGDRWGPVAGIQEEDIHCLASNGRYVFAGTTIDGVFRVRTDTTAPQKVSDGLPPGQVVQSLAVRGDTVAAGLLGAGVYISSDSAGQWLDFNDDQTRNERILALLLRDNSSLYAGTASGKILVTTLPQVRPAASPAVRLSPGPQVAHLDLEIEARLNAALSTVDRLSRTNWLDGATNTNEGTALAFAGQSLTSALYSLDHSQGATPEYKDSSFEVLLSDAKRTGPAEARLDLDQAVQEYRQLRTFCQGLPTYEETSKRLTRAQVAEALSRLRQIVSRIQQHTSSK